MEKKFQGETYDRIFLTLHRKIFKSNIKQTVEHLRAEIPSQSDLKSLGFFVIGVNNVHVHLLYMILQRVLLLWVLVWPLYLLILRYFDNKPPYWGGLAILKKARV